MLRKGDEPIPGYCLDRFLGRGQFGEVWKTTAPGGTTAALKFIDLSGKQGLKEFRGVQRVKEIRHAHLMPITALWLLDENGEVLEDKILASYDPEGRNVKATMDAGMEQETSTPQMLVVAMLLGDKNLQDQLEFYQQAGAGGIPVKELLRYMEETAKGIDFLNTTQHDLGEGLVSIQHCDIKPANVMLVGDSILICDFGLARMLGDVTATATGMVGSPAYMAPECIRRKPSNATDQYSLAITYYELRTGALPFKDQSYMAVLDAHSQGTLDFSLVTPKEQEVLRVATSQRPVDRYPNAVEFVQALRRAVEGAPQPKSKLVAPLLGLVAVLLLSTAAGLWFFWPEPAPVPLPQHTFTLSFDPPDAEVEVKGAVATKKTDEGLELKVEEGRQIRIIATSRPNYVDYDKVVAFSKIKEIGSSPIRLSKSSDYWLGEVRSRIDAEDFDGAVKAYIEHMRLDGSFVPSPVVIPLEGEPTGQNVGQHCVDLGPARSPNRLAVGMINAKVVVYGWPPVRGSEGNWTLPEPVTLGGFGLEVDNVRISADGRWLVTTTFNDVRFFSLPSLAADSAPVVRDGHGIADVVDGTITPDGRWAITGGADGTVLLWDLRADVESVSPVVLHKHQEQVTVLGVSPDSKTLVSFSSKENVVIRWDLEADDIAVSGTRVAQLDYETQRALITTRGELITSAKTPVEGVGFPVESRGLSDGGQPKMIEVHRKPVPLLAISEDEKWLASGCDDGSVHVNPLPGGAGDESEPVVLTGHDDVVTALSFAGESRWLVSGEYLGRLLLWDWQSTGMTGMELEEGHHNDVIALRTSADGRFLLSVSVDKTMRLWDLRWLKVIKRARDESKLGSTDRVDA